MYMWFFISTFGINTKNNLHSHIAMKRIAHFVFSLEKIEFVYIFLQTTEIGI